MIDAWVPVVDCPGLADQHWGALPPLPVEASYIKLSGTLTLIAAKVLLAAVRTVRSITVEVDEDKSGLS